MTESGQNLFDWAKRVDADRFRTALMARDAARPSLMALYAFNGEVARARDAVSEPMLGEIRLQWWVEVLDQIYGDQPVRKHPVAEGLADVIRLHDLPRGKFDALIEARRFDLYDEPMADHKALITYAEATSSGLMSLAAKICGADDAEVLSGPLGRAYALAGLLLAAPFHNNQNRVYIPVEISPADIAAHIATELSDVKLPKADKGRAAYLPAAIIKPRLSAINKAQGDASDLRKLIAISWASLTGRL